MLRGLKHSHFYILLCASYRYCSTNKIAAQVNVGNKKMERKGEELISSRERVKIMSQNYVFKANYNTW